MREHRCNLSAHARVLLFMMENGGFRRNYMLFWFSTRYNSVSFIPISNLLYENNGGMSYLIVHYVSFQ